MYKGFNPKKEGSKDDATEEQMDENELCDDAEDEDDSEENFHYIMTYRDNGKRGKPLPSMLPLRNPYPGEAPWIKKLH